MGHLKWNLLWVHLLNVNIVVSDGNCHAVSFCLLSSKIATEPFLWPLVMTQLLYQSIRKFWRIMCDHFKKCLLNQNNIKLIILIKYLLTRFTKKWVIYSCMFCFSLVLYFEVMLYVVAIVSDKTRHMNQPNLSTGSALRSLQKATHMPIFILAYLLSQLHERKIPVVSL